MAMLCASSPAPLLEPMADGLFGPAHAHADPGRVSDHVDFPGVGSGAAVTHLQRPQRAGQVLWVQALVCDPVLLDLQIAMRESPAPALGFRFRGLH